MAISPTQRTISHLRKTGLIWCGIVERFISHAGPHGIRQDLFGIIDIVALDPAYGIVGIQSCGQAFSEHMKKIKGDGAEAARAWIEVGGHLQLYGWRKLKYKTIHNEWSKNSIWKPRIHYFTLEDFE